MKQLLNDWSETKFLKIRKNRILEKKCVMSQKLVRVNYIESQFYAYIDEKISFSKFSIFQVQISHSNFNFSRFLENSVGEKWQNSVFWVHFCALQHEYETFQISIFCIFKELSLKWTYYRIAQTNKGLKQFLK